MNQISHTDFGSFKTELLEVDFIAFNLTRLEQPEINEVARYFQNLGFNSYSKQLETGLSRKPVFDDIKYNNQFEVNIISSVPYQKKIMQIQLPGLSAHKFYQLVKRKSIQWEKLTKFGIILNRFDLVYQRIPKSTDKIDIQEFINSSFIQFQKSYRNIVCEKNQKGLLLKVGNRKGERYYRIYTTKNSLRFEAELKGNLIKDYHELLVAPNFQEQDFETRLSYEYFKYSFEILNPINEPSHLDWLINRIRPFQFKNIVISDESIIFTHYLNQLSFNKVIEKQHLITLLRLLAFVKTLRYTKKRLTSEFRRYRFPLRDFLKYNNLNSNHYQLNKLKYFFELVKENFIIETFTDKHYRVLVTIPEVFIEKSKQNLWEVEIWIAEDLIHYLHPFLFEDFFSSNMNRDKFQVIFEVIKIFSSNDIRKEFNIQNFLANYSSTLNNKRKNQIKEYFTDYLRLLHKQNKIQNQFIDLRTKDILHISQLTTSHLNIAVFEKLNIKFIKT